MEASLNEYTVSYIRCACLFVTGTALQFLFGDANPAPLAYPWSIIAALCYTYLVVTIYFFSTSHPRIHSWLTSTSCIASLSFLIPIILFMGITGKLLHHTWPFLLLLLYFTTILGVSLMRDIAHIRLCSKTALLSHLSIYLLLVAAIFGNADKRRLSVPVHLGHPMDEGITSDGLVQPIPFTLQLHKFDIEYYPPEIFILNKQRGTLSNNHLSANSQKQTAIYGWTIGINQYYPEATPNGKEFQAHSHIGSTPAAYLTASRPKEKRQGWISAGSFLFDQVTLPLNDSLVLYMEKPEPKNYLSIVTLTPHSGKNSHNLHIEVNHPAHYKSWYIYQKSYDQERGKWSTVSTLECVSDPWYPVVCLSLWILLAAGMVFVIEHRLSRRHTP